MNPSSHIVQVSLQTFSTEVVERSKSVAVLLEFYSEELPASRELAGILLRLAEEYQGKFILARANLAEVAPLAQQLGVRDLPTLVMIHEGQIARTLEGPQTEAALRQLLDPFTLSRMEQIEAEVKGLLAAGNRPGAINLLQQLSASEPGNHAVQSELADLLIQQGETDSAEKLLAGIPADEKSADKPRHRLEFARRAGELPHLAELLAAVQKEGDLDSRFKLAVAQIADNQMEAALENLLQILQADRQYGEDAARLTMIKVFDLLGRGDPLASTYRRRMFNFMH